MCFSPCGPKLNSSSEDLVSDPGAIVTSGGADEGRDGRSHSVRF